MANYTERKTWSASAVRSMCIRMERYTRGDCEAYSKMLEFVDTHEPTIENIEQVAWDIVRHSDMTAYGMEDEECVEGIMFDLANDCIIYSFERA